MCSLPHGELLSSPGDEILQKLYLAIFPLTEGKRVANVCYNGMILISV